MPSPFTCTRVEHCWLLCCILNYKKRKFELILMSTKIKDHWRIVKQCKAIAFNRQCKVDTPYVRVIFCDWRINENQYLKFIFNWDDTWNLYRINMKPHYTGSSRFTLCRINTLSYWLFSFNTRSFQVFHAFQVVWRTLGLKKLKVHNTSTRLPKANWID